jgi:hypothetical protein
MVTQDSLLVTLVKLVDRVPMPALPPKRGRGHPIVYPDRLFLTEPTGPTSKRFAVSSVATARTPISTQRSTSSTAGETMNYAPARTGKQSRPCCCNDMRLGRHNTVGRSPTARPVLSSTGVGES